MEAVPFHIGVVTGDLDGSMKQLSAALGVTWTTPGSGGAVFTGTDGSPQPQPVSCISREGPIHLDLIKDEPGSIWAAPDGPPRIHHFAYWTGDLEGDIARLAEEGWKLELTLPGDDGRPTVFAYLVRDDGFRLELIDEAGRDTYAARLERGQLAMIRSVKAEFDFASPDIAGPQFWDAVEKLRELGPLVWVETGGGFWAATSYEMNLRVAQDWQSFTSSAGVALSRPSFEAMPRLVPIELDPPRHRTFRREVNPALTVKAVSPLEDDIRAIADEIIDGFIDRGACDIAVDFARKFPGTVFFRLLVHSTDEEFRAAEQAARRISFESDDKEQFARSAAELRAWAGRVFDDHAAGKVSGADLAEAVMRLADAGSGENWPDDERKAGLQILAQGGIGTSASAIGAIMLALSADPVLQGRVRGDLSLVPALVEEMLRLEAPVPIMFRTARRDVSIDGNQIREGDKVCLIFGAAGRDPEVFDHPGQVDLDRPHCRHMTFGTGVHRCIGSNLARLMIRVATEQLLTRLGEFGIPDGGEVRYSSRQSRGPSSIPLEFTRLPSH